MTRSRAVPALSALVLAPALVLVGAGGAPALAQLPGPSAPEVFLPTPGPVGPLARYASPSSAPVDAVRRRQVALLAAAGVDPRLLAAGQASGRPARQASQRTAAGPGDGVVDVSSSSSGVSFFGGGAPLQPAGDLDGDGRIDLLEARYAGNDDGSSVLGLVARRAADGRVVWSRRVALPPGRFAFPVPATVGSPARPGVALLEFGFRGSGASGSTVSLAVTALAGRTGATTWRYAASGTSGDGGQQHVPSLLGTLDGGRTTGFLVGVTDAQAPATPASSTRSGALQPVLVDGASGTARELGAAVRRDDALPQAQGVPDLTGDGVDDVAVLVGGGSPEVSLRRSGDGATAWTTTSVPVRADPYVVPGGRLTGSRVQDLAVLTGTDEQDPGLPAGPAPAPAPTSAPATAPAHGSVVLLRGTDGASRFSVPGDAAFALGRAGSPRVPALGVLTADTTRSGRRTTVSLEVDAVDAAGRALYSRTQSLSADSSQDVSDDETGGFAFGFPIGDLGRDGAQDLQALLFVESGDAERSSHRLLDGATGAVLQRAGDPLGGSLSSHGDDLVTVSAGKGVLVTGRSGRTGRPVFSVRLAPSTSLRYGYASAAALRPGPCDDVLVGAGSPAHDYAAVLSSTGRLRWSLLGETGSADVRKAVVAAAGTSRCS